MATIIGDKFSNTDLEAVWVSFKEFLKKMRGECPVFRVLVVGETGAGKSTLINNLVGKDVVTIGHSYESETATISKHSMEVEGVPIVLYDTPGLGDSRGDRDDQYLRDMRDILKKRDIHLVIYCLKLTETRLRDSLIRTFQEYHKIGVNWEQSIIALTFADALPVPQQVRKKAGFEMSSYFNGRVAEFRSQIAKMLVERVGVIPEVASEIKCYPTTSDPEEELKNKEKWFVPLWLDILELLSPGAAMRFLEMHADNIEMESEEGEEMVDPQAPKDDSQDTEPTRKPKPIVKLNRNDKKRLGTIIMKKLKEDTGTGVIIGAIAGGVVGIVGGPVGVPIGAGVGAAMGFSIGLLVGFIKSLRSEVRELDTP